MEEIKAPEEFDAQNYTVNNGHNEKEYDASQIQILEGLEAGERIVTGGAQFLTEKDRIRMNNE